MAVYDGFFDAVQDEDTGEYDRAYSAGDFTQYFGQFIGSGVCIHENPDSFKVRLEDGAAIIGPGYLFIQGYWLKNDADYSVTLPVSGTAAIAAHLNLGKRMIEIEARAVAQVYPDSLVLAIVDTAAGTVEDTRHNIDICGVIDSSGSLSGKVEYAVNYIDKEINTKLEQIEKDIAEQEKRLDKKIEDVQAVADSIVPPPIGSIKFSAAQNAGPEWLMCDGSFINDTDYPDLVAALGRLIPSGDKFQVLSEGEIAPQITNGTLYGGRLWVYSYSAKKLYGVDVNGEAPVKEISVEGGDGFENMVAPSKMRPIALSVVPLKSSPGESMIFVAQIIGSSFQTYENENNYDFLKSKFIGNSEFLLYGAKFTGNESAISLSRPFLDVSIKPPGSLIRRIEGEAGGAIPYVVSKIAGGKEAFFCIPYGPVLDKVSEAYSELIPYLSWGVEDTSAALLYIECGESRSSSGLQEILAFNRKNQNELVWINWTNRTIKSLPNQTFERDGSPSSAIFSFPTLTNTLIAGASSVIIQAAANANQIITISRNELTFCEEVNTGLSLPNSARIFPDAAAYLWGKDIFLIFVGTGIIFSRTLEEGSFGYLDTTSVLGTITQFGYLDYSADEGTLYLIGQDTANRVKAAKIVLNTLYDYANNGAWLPLIAADGVPAYIKAKEAEK